MKGNLLRLMLVFALALILAACGSDDDTADSNANKVGVGNTVSLSRYADTSAFSASSSGPLTIVIQWSIVSRPPNSQAVIINSNTPTPDFRPDIAGKYKIRVVISQNGEVLADNEVTIVASVDDLFPVKPATHILTTDICEACHLPGTWLLNGVDHNQVIGTCVSCHNGVTATGMSPTHIVTSDACDVCHITITWGTPVTTVDHSAFSGNCISCHDNVIASGKNASHINTTDNCDACHRTFPAPWVPVPVAEVDHNEVLGICSGCHNGTIAIGKGTGHVITTEECDACHVTAPQGWLIPFTGGTGTGGGTTAPPPGTDHSSFVGSCVSCHNGVDASGKSPTHPLTSNLCDACHTETAWLPIFLVDHNQTVGSCVSCHNGIAATGLNATHIPTTDDCSACHFTQAWLPAFGGTSGNDTPATDPLPEKPATHLPTSDLCTACHLPAGWTLGGVDHTQVIGSCASCHNGTLASGKPTFHIPSTDICDSCHNTIHWLPLASTSVDHAQVIGVCSSCHSLPAGHVATSLECDACHFTSPQGWVNPFADSTGTPIPDTGTDHSQFVGTCVSCHNGTDASGKTATHINTTDGCEFCHNTDVWVPLPGLSVDHTQVAGTCASCHNGIIATGKGASHIPTTEVCGVCHSTQLWVVATVDHSGFSGNCFTCHNNMTASGKNAAHINTSNSCDACHSVSPAQWVPVSSTAVDHTQVIGACVSCHSLPGGHINSTSSCEACHNGGPQPWAPVANSAVDHSEVLGSCTSCHNGVIASGKLADHIVTSEDCNVCHLINMWLPATQQ